MQFYIRARQQQKQEKTKSTQQTFFKVIFNLF